MDRPGDTLTKWLAAHPRITCALVCALILAAFRLENL
jgi:hypothetical protein